MWLFDEATDKLGGLFIPATVSAISLFGVPLSDWVYMLTLLLVVVQLTGKLLNGIRGAWRMYVRFRRTK